MKILKAGTRCSILPVWICGDCHLGNLGPIASVKGQVEIAISDFDQTVIGDRLHGIQG